MNTAIVLIAGLSLASSLAVAQEQEDQEFNPNRDVVTEPGNDPQTSMDEQEQGTSEASGEGLSNMTADELEGKKVVTLAGEEIGEIGEVGESPAHGGRIATVEVGGFLGVGEKTIAIPLSELDKSVSDEDSVRTTMTRSSIESQPEFDDSGFTPDNE